jgi:hypothetical protein
MNERDEIIRETCRLLFVKPKHLAELGIGMDDYPALERFFKVPGWFTDPAKQVEAKQALANHRAFLENAGRRFQGHEQA